MSSHSLAARRPYCRTIFKVVPDQLKLRQGFVKCSVCRTIFNGTQNLLDEEDFFGSRNSTENNTHKTVSKNAQANEENTVQLQNFVQQQALGSDHFLHHSPHLYTEENSEKNKLNPDITLEPTHSDQRAQEANTQSDSIEQEKVARHEQTLNPSSDQSINSVKDLSTDTGSLKKIVRPSFFKDLQTKHSLFYRVLPKLNILLISLLMVQVLIWKRNEWLAYFPSLKPYWNTVCQPLGCTVSPPERLNQLSIESSELQEHPQYPEQMILFVLLRNHSEIALKWPHLLLTLKDAGGQIIVRKTVHPNEYLAKDPLLLASFKLGIAENSEQSLQIISTLKDYKPSAYEVQMYYPGV